MRNAIFILLCLFTLGSVFSAVAQTEGEFRLQRFQAHRTMIAGDPVQAAADLLNAIRALPQDDSSLVDRASGNLQLLVFDINYLMTGQMRQDFFANTLDTENTEIDAFIVTLHEASIQKTTQELEAFLLRLWDYSRSSNQFIAPIALYLLANPYYSSETEAGMVASDQMAARYPNLEATRNMLALPLYHRKARPGMAAQWIRAYRGKPQVPGIARARETTIAEKSVAALEPLIDKLEPLLDRLSHSETKRQGVEGLVALIEDQSEDWQDRYTYLRMLEPEMNAPPGGAGAQGYWKFIKPSMESLANQGVLTPDVFRARVLLCRVACAARDYDNAGYWAERVLTEQDRLFEHPERILYEEAVNTYMSYAETLVKGDRNEQGAQAYERLAAFYPNSAVAIDCGDLAAQARQRAN